MAVARLIPTSFDEAVLRLIASREDQGLAPTVKDPTALSQIANVVRATSAPGAARPPSRRRASAVGAAVNGDGGSA